MAALYVLLQQLLNGLVLSGLYLLLSLGLALIFGVLEIPHFAFGAVAVTGGYVGYVLVNLLGLPVWAGIALAVVISAAIGVLLDLLPYRDVNKLPPLNAFIVALGLMTFLNNTLQLLFGPDQVQIKLHGEQLVYLGQLVLTELRVALLLVAIVIMVVTWLILRRTKIGIAVRAVAANREAAALMGIDIRRISAFVFAYTSAIGAVVGIIYGGLYSLIPTRGDNLIFFGFAAIVLAGMGNLMGTIVASVILGVFQAFMIGYVSSAFSTVAVFGLIILLLILKPMGLFGKEVRR
ncbi:MAG: branched-chain amino acid ABC transporter permease [Clostridia bacterium]|nr:branched-chain amino acid ABC transporter permease [Clostridia bacterium]